MARHRAAIEVTSLVSLVRNRAEVQPAGRRPDPTIVESEIMAALDRWLVVARRRTPTLIYWEYTGGDPPRHDVVLGDLWHERQGRDVVFRNVPQSLRDVEETLGIEV